MLSKPGILLINLGTPEEPTPKAVRVYLREFLSDPRVVEIPRLLWLPILYLFVLTTRPKPSAARYEQIWTRDGSPLKFHTERQAALVRGYLGDRLRVPLDRGLIVAADRQRVGHRADAQGMQPRVTERVGNRRGGLRAGQRTDEVDPQLLARLLEQPLGEARIEEPAVPGKERP